DDLVPGERGAPPRAAVPGARQSVLMERVDRRGLLERGAALVSSGPWWRLPVASSLTLPLSELVHELHGPVVARGAAGYEKARLLFDTRFDGVKPMAVAFCDNATDVQKTIRWARKHGVRIAARAGGHSYGGYSTTTGVILDVTRMHGVGTVG